MLSRLTLKTLFHIVYNLNAFVFISSHNSNMNSSNWFFDDMEPCVESEGNNCLNNTHYANIEYGVAIAEVVLYLGLALLGIVEIFF